MAQAQVASRLGGEGVPSVVSIKNPKSTKRKSSEEHQKKEAAGGSSKSSGGGRDGKKVKKSKH